MTTAEKKAAYYRKNILEISKKNAEYREKNRESLRLWQRTIDGKYASYKSKAKGRNLSFELTKEEFKSFWQVDCEYCGEAISTIGLDRIDSSIGYNIDNVVPCCSRCNEMKMDSSREAWMDKMFTILKKQGVI